MEHSHGFGAIFRCQRREGHDCNGYPGEADAGALYDRVERQKRLIHVEIILHHLIAAVGLQAEANHHHGRGDRRGPAIMAAKKPMAVPMPRQPMKIPMAESV